MNLVQIILNYHLDQKITNNNISSKRKKVIKIIIIMDNLVIYTQKFLKNSKNKKEFDLIFIY